MKAQIIRGHGGPEVFELVDLPDPTPGPGEVLVRVGATSVNPVDWKLRRYGPEITPALPAVLHGDVAGVVERVGAEVAAFQVGDEVYGCAGGVVGRGGALAELMVADARLLAAKPETLTMREAAALPLVAITAWEALVDKVDVQAGQTVLVHAAAGGVGHIGVQLARARGARVFATASTPEKIALGRELGAEAVVDYRAEPVADYVARLTDGKGFDVVFDTIGGDNLERSFEAARNHGVVASILTEARHDLTLLHRKSLTLHAVLMLVPMLTDSGLAHHGDILRQVAALVDDGQLRPVVDPERFGLAEAGGAHEKLETGRAIGKVVIDVADH